jgi:hypothetical protein
VDNLIDALKGLSHELYGVDEASDKAFETGEEVEQ